MAETSIEPAPSTGLILNEIRAYMARQRKSQTELAARMNLANSAVSRRLSGAVPLTLPELVEICDWLGITPEQLFERAR